MTALTATKALYFSTLYLMLSESSTVQRDIVDGQTDEPILFYQYATVAAQTFMYAVCGLSWSMFTLLSLFTNPWWFLGTQVVNLSLYYYAVYKPYAASDLGTKNPQINSLTFEPFSSETLQEKKNQAQTRFVFGFFGFLGVDSLFLFKDFREFLHSRLHNVDNTEADPVLSGLLNGIDDMDAVLTRDEIIRIQQDSQSIGIPERVFQNALDVDVLTKGTDIADALSQYRREQHSDGYWTLSTQVKRLQQLPNLLMQLPRQIWNNARKLGNFQYFKRCALDLLWRCGRFALNSFINVMVRVINVFELLSTLIEYIELGPLLSFLLKHATSFTMHATVGLHLYWYAPLLVHSAPAAIALSIGILSLLNYHRLLAPGTVSTLNDMTQTSRFFRPFIIGDLFIKLRALFSALTLCSRSAGEHCLQFIAFLIRQDPLYSIPKYLAKNFGVLFLHLMKVGGEICSQIREGKFSYSEFKKSWSDTSNMIDDIPLDVFQKLVTQGIAYLDTYSKMFTDWSVKRRLLDAAVPFKFKEQSLDQAAWVSRWKQHLDQYLNMKTVLLYSDTDMHCTMVDDDGIEWLADGNESAPIMSDAKIRKEIIKSAQSDQFHAYYQKMQDGRYVIVSDALRWNRAAAQPKQQGFFRSFWQRLMGLLSSNSDMDTFFAFFVDNLSDEIQKISNDGNCGWVYDALSEVAGARPQSDALSRADFNIWYTQNCVTCSGSEQRTNKNRLTTSLKTRFNQELKRINDSGSKGDEIHQLLTQFGASIAKLIREYAQFSSSSATGQQLKKRILNAFRVNIMPNISVCPDGAVGGLKEGQIELDQASIELDGTASWLNKYFCIARVNAESGLSQKVATEISNPMRYINSGMVSTMGNLMIGGEAPKKKPRVYAEDISVVYESRSIVGPGHPFGPVYALSLASTPSPSSQGLDVNNRHKNNIARAWCGLNTNIDELSMLERSELGHGQIFCPAVNYQALRDTLPIGHHFKNCLVEAADDQIILPEYFERRDTQQSLFYTDWISYLCKEGYLNTDIASDELSPDQLEERAAALYELVSQQLDLSNSLFYKLALYDQLHMQGIDVNRLNWDQLVALANNDQGSLGGELFSHIGNRKKWHQTLITDTKESMAKKLHRYLECPLTQFRVISNLLHALVNRSPNRSQIDVDKACKHLHHQIILPSVLTLLLDQGILYRGAGTDDINIDAVYPTLESLSQETLADHPTTAHPTKRSWFGFVRDWAASLVAGLRMTPHVLYVLTSIIIKQTLITSKGLAIGAIHFALSLPVTLFYSIPVGIYQYGYVGQIASGMLYAAKQAIYRLVVRPVYYAAYAMLTLCDWCVVKPIRFVAHAINALVDWLFIAPARALFNRLFSLVVPGEKPQPSTSESLGGRPNTTRDATDKQANNATSLFSRFFRALTDPFNLTSEDSASLGSY